MDPDACSVASRGRLSDAGRCLTRRSRVRRKNSRRDDESSSEPLSTSGDISSGQLFVKIPPPNARAGSSPKSLGALETSAPPRPPRSPRRLHTAPVFGSEEIVADQQRVRRHRTRSTDPATRCSAIGDARGRETRSENGHERTTQRSRGLSLPRYAFRNNSLSDSSEQPSPLTPSVFNDVPPMPVFARNRRYKHQTRDSGATQQSTASSSLYPKSTSTEGSYLSPPFLAAQDIDDPHIVTVDPVENPHLHELEEMDADDVSYRLRLLMRNNYYLPPAHSKPFSDIPSPDTPKKSPVKAPSPTFLDFFKVVRKKSALLSENKAATSPPAPLLRTTSDSSTLSGFLRPQQLAPSPRREHAAFLLPQSRQEPKGRVVVVRERVDDLASVAKQVEEELKARERRRTASDTSHSETIQGDFVDPTDFVDLPPVPPNGFFGPQAALLRGMGIDSSLGAALLADQLPPSSPGIWSIESEDAAWRKALLHAAVGHSLSNSSANTPGRSVSGSSRVQMFDGSSPAARSTSPSVFDPSIVSPLSSHPPLPATATNDNGPCDTVDNPELVRKPIIGQRILNRIIDEDDTHSVDGPLPSSEKPSSVEVDRNAKPANQIEAPQGLFVTAEPIRASSPTVPTMPLLPPPRRTNSTPTHSNGSQSDNAQGKEDQQVNGQSGAGPNLLQPERNTLRLSDSYETHVGLSGAFGDLTPPASQHNSATLSVVKPGPEESAVISENLSTTSGSHYSDDEDGFATFHTPLEHTRLSTPAASRASLGSMSTPRPSYTSSLTSPTTSAFRDAIDRSPYAGSFATDSVVNTLGDNAHIPAHAFDDEDSRYAPVSPPPRVSSSLAFSALSPPPRSRRANISSGPSIDVSAVRDHLNEQDDPETPTSLHVPRLTVQDPHVLNSRSNSYPASPISFFDAVEMQSRQEEEEESSDEDGEDEGDARVDVRDDVSIASSSPGGYQSDSAGPSVIDHRAGSVHSDTHTPRRTLGKLMQQRNASSPQLGVHSSASEHSSGLGYGGIDRRAVTNVPQSQSRMSFWRRKHGKRHELFTNPPRVSESTADWLKHEAAKEAFTGIRRPQTAGSRTGTANARSGLEGQTHLDPSVRRLDGMLVQHMKREKEVLKRITATISKSSSSN
ncbi:uncharacterized protein FOMMEDRAFT_17105 [Fomitiporia mediterranea MF3/22]|uniref:uncharacterized protein n=1 Tax=Fomitiporia mediterranea (strain MF3/22) TaxID=694068 RepID=UPI0004407F26|nr:uncharacterized protein FOMMEDRAFT_17105 [Fomitiporia mediterranea MF3/22]EJD06599.1 hypothetical protein FOMMEDRAFT_17105 [Fomitiporia mediterranea MF3/22]